MAPRTKTELFLGVDLSLIGTGCVLLEHAPDQPSPIIKGIMFFTKTKGDYKRWQSAPIPDGKMFTRDLIIDCYLSDDVGTETSSWQRTVRVAESVLDLVQRFQPTAIAIENHAYGAQGASVYELGHVHALLRYGLNAGGLQFNGPNMPFRLYGPERIKTFATGKGSAPKELMVIEAERQGFPCTAFGTEPMKNLADAFWLAKLLHLEWNIREGRVPLEALTKKMRELFTKKTGNLPPLLDRPFVDFRKS